MKLINCSIHKLFSIITTATIFLCQWITKPHQVGAIWPSSKKLAQRLAAQVPIDNEGLIIELGAGTGVVTQALLDRGIAAERLIIIEYCPKFVQLLRKKFPELLVIEGDAAKLGELLPSESKVAAIVSCLPLKSLPSNSVKNIVAQWNNILITDGVVIQFTYDLRKRLDPTMSHFTLNTSSLVWRNMPPARVLTLGLNS